jgi:hypothetical protein
VGISPDNRWLVTGGLYDNTARLWPLEVEDLIDLARITVGRKFYCRRMEAALSKRAVPQDVSGFTGSVASIGASIPRTRNSRCPTSSHPK